jgi:hypothetical protein
MPKIKGLADKLEKAACKKDFNVHISKTSLNL